MLNLWFKLFYSCYAVFNIRFFVFCLFVNSSVVRLVNAEFFICSEDGRSKIDQEWVGLRSWFECGPDAQRHLHRNDAQQEQDEAAAAAAAALPLWYIKWPEQKINYFSSRVASRALVASCALLYWNKDARITRSAGSVGIFSMRIYNLFVFVQRANCICNFEILQ